MTVPIQQCFRGWPKGSKKNQRQQHVGSCQSEPEGKRAVGRLWGNVQCAKAKAAAEAMEQDEEPPSEQKKHQPGHPCKYAVFRATAH